MTKLFQYAAKKFDDETSLINLAEILVDYGYDFKDNFDDESTLFLTLTEKGFLETMIKLSTFGSDHRNIHKETEMTALMRAVLDNNIEIVEFLCKIDPDIVDIYEECDNPINVACERGHLDVVKILYKNGFSLEIEDHFKCVPLLLASIEEHTDVVDFICSTGVSIDETDDIGSTSLFYAAENGNIDILKILIKHGANVNIQNCDGDTALMHAENIEVAEILINAGAKLDIVDNNNKDAICRAKDGNNIDLVNFLMKRR